MFCCCFLFSYLFSYFIVLMIPVNIYPTFLRLIFRIGRIMATDDPSEISFSVLQGTLPGQPIFTARCCASAVLANPTQPTGQPNPWTSFLCPSVCRCSTKTAKRRITQTTPQGESSESSFLVSKISAKFDRGHPLRGHQMQVRWVKIGDFQQITGYMYISKTVQDRRMVSIKVE